MKKKNPHLPNVRYSRTALEKVSRLHSIYKGESGAGDGSLKLKALAAPGADNPRTHWQLTTACNASSRGLTPCPGFQCTAYTWKSIRAHK